MVVEEGGDRGQTPAEQCSSLTASSPERWNSLHLPPKFATDPPFMLLPSPICYAYRTRRPVSSAMPLAQWFLSIVRAPGGMQPAVVQVFVQRQTV
jgi:hypothetical protein